MQNGLSEWIYGYQEVLKAGEDLMIPMPTWRSYETYVADYISQHPKLEAVLQK